MISLFIRINCLAKCAFYAIRHVIAKTLVIFCWLIRKKRVFNTLINQNKNKQCDGNGCLKYLNSVFREFSFQLLCERHHMLCCCVAALKMSRIELKTYAKRRYLSLNICHNYYSLSNLNSQSTKSINSIFKPLTENKMAFRTKYWEHSYCYY